MEDRRKDTTGSVRERSRGDRGKRKHSDLHVGSTTTRRSSDSEGEGDVLCGWRKDNTRRVKDSSSVSSWLSESDQSSSELETRKKKHKKRKYQNRKNDKRDSSSESDQSSSELETRKKKHKKRQNRNKRNYKQDSSSDSSWSSESDQSSLEFHIKKKHKKREKKRKRISKHSKKTTKKHSKKKSKSKETRKQKDGKISEKKGFNAEQSGRQLKDCLQSGPQQSEVITNTSEPLAKKKRSMAPMTREEHEKQQSVVRRVYDPETGRHRLVKGDGEIIEEIVSQQRHREINKTATRGDGAFFQAALGFCDK